MKQNHLVIKRINRREEEVERGSGVMSADGNGSHSSSSSFSSLLLALLVNLVYPHLQIFPSN
jgi:hypothetical protein